MLNRFIVPLAVLVAIPIAMALSTIFLNLTGVSYEQLRGRASLQRLDDPASESFRLSDGSQATASCRRPGGVVRSILRCSLDVDQEYLVKVELVESSGDELWTLNAHLQLLPPQTDNFRALPKRLAPSELLGTEYPVASIKRGPLGIFVRGAYDVDREALKALVASYATKAVAISQLEVTNADIERMSGIFAGVVAPHVGVFQLRQDPYVMIAEGDMEYVITVCFFVALLLLLASVFVDRNERGALLERGKLWTAADALGGTLTYLGLLGTLIGMFGTVLALSGIDYVDPMIKVFDQTSSFGSMSLAIGTSVVGLTGSIIIWMAQIAIDILRRKTAVEPVGAAVVQVPILSPAAEQPADDDVRAPHVQRPRRKRPAPPV